MIWFASGVQAAAFKHRCRYGRVIFSAALPGSALCCLRPFSDCAGWVRNQAGVAQLVELLICNQAVGGSNPFASSSPPEHREEFGCTACQEFFLASVRQPTAIVLTRRNFGESSAGTLGERILRRKPGRQSRAQVAEWLMAADCKSAAQRATEVRILPCAPVLLERRTR